MPDTNTPIQVSGNTAPLAAALRYLIVTLGSFAVGRGWVDAEQLPGIATAIVTIGTAAYGLYRTYRTKADLVVTAEAAPDRVAQVTK